MSELGGCEGVGAFECEFGGRQCLGEVAGLTERVAAQSFDLKGVEGFAGGVGGGHRVVEGGEGGVDVAIGDEQLTEGGECE